MSDPEDGHGEPGPRRSIEAAQGLVHLPGIYNSFGDLVFYYASTDEPRYLLIANQMATAASDMPAQARGPSFSPKRYHAMTAVVGGVA